MSEKKARIKKYIDEPVDAVQSVNRTMDLLLGNNEDFTPQELNEVVEEEQAPKQS